MDSDQLESIEGVAEVTRLAGPAAPADAPPDVLIEIPHGATRRADYDAHFAQLAGPFPDDLHEFFHVNTDVGAPELGRHIADGLLRAAPTRVVQLLRCLIPRTFIDVNRKVDHVAAGPGSLTAALPPYVTNSNDRRNLLFLHHQYTELANRAWAELAASGGLGLMPHTYGPVSLAVEQVDEHIVTNLRRAHEPDLLEQAPLRPEVDLITRTPEGEQRAADVEQALTEGYAAVGITAEVARCYSLLPGSMAAVRADALPDRTLTWEVRRDLLVPAWLWNREMHPDPAKVRRAGDPVVHVVDAWLRARGR